MQPDISPFLLPSCCDRIILHNDWMISCLMPDDRLNPFNIVLRGFSFWCFFRGSKMAEKSKLSAKQIKRFNDDLADLELIKQDIERAIRAGVPNCDKLIEVCESHQEAIAKLKAQYAEKS